MKQNWTHNDSVCISVVFLILTQIPLSLRMIPPTSKTFLVNNLAAGTMYDLCVLAIYDDGITSLTATSGVGCIQFTTEQDYVRCHFMQSQFLGGTMIIIIGGIIVASVLVFIIILMIRYKVCNNNGQHKVTKVSNVYSQTNGAQIQGCSGTLPQSVSKQAVGHEENAQCCKVANDNVIQPSNLFKSGLLYHYLCFASYLDFKHVCVPKQKERLAQSQVPNHRVEAVTNVESQSVNRNNSTALQLASVSSVILGACILKRAHSKPSKFLTLPAERARARHRYSLNGGIKGIQLLY